MSTAPRDATIHSHRGVHHEKEVLRIGAEVTDRTKLTAAGKAVSLDRLKSGDRVGIEFRRVATGDEAISVEVQRGAKS